MLGICGHARRALGTSEAFIPAFIPTAPTGDAVIERSEADAADEAGTHNNQEHLDLHWL
jgi:hypothetical protein